MCTHNAVNTVGTDDGVGGSSCAVFEVDRDRTVWLVVYDIHALVEMGTF